MVQYFKDLWTMFTQMSMAQLTFLDFLVIVILVGVVGFAAFWLIKGIWICVKHIFKCLFKGKTKKCKCSKITCPYCGRTLDQCTCERNKGKSCAYRLRQYRREQKSKTNADKQKVKLTLTKTKTVKAEAVAKKKKATTDETPKQTVVSNKAAHYIDK